MSDLALLDRAYQVTNQYFVERGFGPHYTELARDLELPMERGREVLRELVESGIPAWQHPGTDYLVSFAPFNSMPTQYRVSVDGVQRWFAQCAFESLAMRWHFPGRTVRIDAPCLDCGEPIAVEMRDEDILAVEPGGIVGYAYDQIGGPAENRPYR